MAEAPLIFINPTVIARIEDGSFVPKRKAKPSSLNMPERRDTVSPLAVARRCVRYEPHVFTHRKQQILTIANHLNNPDKKMLLLAGEQGTGKTSLIRGVVELMSSESQQLLWFDVNRHTDFSEIIQFLIHYITLICSAIPNKMNLPKETDEPFAQLEALIGQIADIPLLIVIDNVEYIVDNDYRLNSYPFKEVMNFLLSFANIKMILAGERLPYADISPNQKAVSEIKLAGLSERDMVDFITARSEETVDTALLEELYERTHGAPWLAKILLYLQQHQHSPKFYEQLNALMAKGNAPSAVTRFVFSNLSDIEKQLLQTMAMIRHPVSMEALVAIARFCHPVSGLTDADYENAHVEKTIAKPVLKIIYPPQEVLKHIQDRADDPDDTHENFKPWFELYRQIRKVIYNHLPKDERDRLHNLLQDFYMGERQKAPGERLVHLNSRALLSEAKFHSQSARKRTLSRPNKTKTAAEAPAEAREEVGTQELDSRAYLYKHTKPLSKERYLTLDDYRSIPTPGGTPEEDILDEEPVLREDPGLEPEHFEIDSFQIDTSDIATPEIDWSDVPLSEEERALLFSDTPEKAPTQRLPEKSDTEPEPLPESLRLQKPKTEEPGASNRRQNLEEIAESFTSKAPVDEAEKQLQQQLSRAVAERNKPLLAQLLLKLAEYRTSRGLYHSAEECLEKVMALEPALEPALMADIHRLRGAIKQETYQHNDAVHELQQALKYLDLLNTADGDKRGSVYRDLAEIHAYRGQSKEAIAAFEKAIDAFANALSDTPERSRMNLAECHFQLAGVYDDEDRLEEALAHYKKSLAIDRELGHEESCAATLANMGHVYAALEQPAQSYVEEAIACFQESLSLDKKTGNPEGQIRTLDAMARLLPENAEVYYKQALAVAMTEKNPLWQASAYLKLGNLYYRNDMIEEALTHYRRALSSGQHELSEESLALLHEKIEEVERVQ